MKVKKADREKLTYYLKQFYKHYPQERFTIFHAVKSFKKRLKDNKDAWVGIAGETGTGKSLFVLMFMILFGRPVDLEKNVAYVPKGTEIMDKFDKLNFNCLLVDEAAREMRAVNWQSKAQQGVNTKAMTDRFKNNLVFLNMPNFNEFTKSMRQGNLQFRAILPYRTDKYARVIIQRKSRNWRSDDPWGDTLANDKYDKAEKKFKEINNDTILNIERSLPQTIMDFIVPNLEKILPDFTTEYERLKSESREIAKKLDDEGNTDKQKVKMKKDLENLKSRVTKLLFYNQLNLGNMKVGQAEMAEALGMSAATFKKYLVKEVQIEKEEKSKNPRVISSDDIDKNNMMKGLI